jgi:hypothetical protein
MSELKNLSAILEGGAVPAGYNGKAIGKLSKTYLKLENRKVVNLYPIRTVMHEDSRYCLYACPLKGTEIDEATLQSIKAEVDTLEIGEIRYDSVQSCGYDYYIVDPDTGRHILTGQRDMDSVMEISDHYDGVILFSKSVFSPRKANQLDCAYALIGIEKQPNEFKIEAIPNSAIGQAPTILEFEAPQESPAVEKYRSAPEEELFYCLFPNGSADTPETRGRSTHTACRRSGIHNSFPAYFNGRSRFRRPLIRYAPKHPRKGFRGKIETHRTVAGLWQDIERHVCRDFSANEPFRLQNLSIILNLEHRNIAEEA